MKKFLRKKVFSISFSDRTDNSFSKKVLNLDFQCTFRQALCAECFEIGYFTFNKDFYNFNTIWFYNISLEVKFLPDLILPNIKLRFFDIFPPKTQFNFVSYCTKVSRCDKAVCILKHSDWPRAELWVLYKPI